ncbi:MAG TPA: class I SAM-dependent methyltransferase [Chloroflexaceae bacterium]|nr:class I SAM-dependent methyltransferase [Chloroflexaceae bacterium]
MTNDYDAALPGVHQAPNIQTAPEVYELENRAVDPEGLIEAAMWRLAPWAGKVFLDLGAGTGFHLARWHRHAAHVFAVEPHAPSRLVAMRRAAEQGLLNTSVLSGSAERTPLRDRSVDVVQARFAYFFGPGAEPGLAELERIVRPGGAAFIVDNDLRGGTFAAWLRQSPHAPQPDPAAVEGFWADHGFELDRIASEWRFERRADLEAVVRLEFGETLAERLLAGHAGTRVEYHYCLYWRRY